jgi:hypothetical protein
MPAFNKQEFLLETRASNSPCDPALPDVGTDQLISAFIFSVQQKICLVGLAADRVGTASGWRRTPEGLGGNGNSTLSAASKGVADEDRDIGFNSPPAPHGRRGFSSEPPACDLAVVSQFENQ